VNVHHYPLATGIRPTPEFAKKGLASFAVNVGLKCDHHCTYCSSGSLLRCHPAFAQFGESPFGYGYAIVDPDMPEKVARDAKRSKKRGLVQLCTTVDAWAPAAKDLDLGRRCLEALLAEPGWTVRILTKNAAVADDFDLIAKYRDRVLVGISMTGTIDRTKPVSAIEPNASSIPDRMDALETAHRMGLRTYGMLCPLLPGIADRPDQIGQLVRLAEACGAEEIFVEPVNPRGAGLKNTEEALRRAGFHAEADAVARIRSRAAWSPYVVRLVQHVQHAVRHHSDVRKLRFLLYPSGLANEDAQEIRMDDEGVVWLTEDAPPRLHAVSVS